MHDIRALRDNPDAFDAAMHKRGIEPVAQGLLLLDTDRRQNLYQAQELQAERNQLSKKIGTFRSAGQDMSEAEQESVEIRDRIAVLEARAAALKNEIDTTLASLPNILDEDVPPGADEASNRVGKPVGTPIPFEGKPREHFELGEKLGLMDFERAARMSGSRFTILRGQLARLERALGQYMLDLHTGTHGYTEVQVPLLVNDAAFYGSGQLPKFRDDAFQTTDGRWLIPTSEVPLTNLVANEIVPVAELPMRFTALSECFRSEAGSAGRDTRGMLRQHQFRKVELVSITEPDKSEAEHERMTRCAEAVLDGLGLHYRRMLLCAGDTGFGAAKTFDLEVWLPGQGAWREISSCSNTHAFQARRMNARMRGADGKVAGFVHTLNGSGVATGRALIAVMETYQLPDGGIRVPEVLKGYMGGLDNIG